MILRDIQGVTLKIKMTKEKELQEFKERCLGLSCSPYSDNFSCEDCPLKNETNN